MKILLISPGKEGDIDSRIIREIPYMDSAAFFAPHAVAAVAALTPPEHQVYIQDEYMRGPVDTLLEKNDYDIIGISLTTNQFRRSKEIVEFCKEKKMSATIVAGGIGAQNLMHKMSMDFDVIFYGEAEETWPRFLEDFKKGNYKNVYQHFSKPDMTKTPIPRWEIIREDIPFYGAVSVQTTRGCPFDCSFCDVIYTNGRKPRNKLINQVLDEIRLLESMNAKMIFIADDNFAGSKNYAKELLRELVKLNNSFKVPMGYMTQVDITIADDEELLELMADSNFIDVMIGIESVNEESLKEYNKQQNLRVNIREAVVKIQSYGIAVLGHMIIGTDADDKNTFQQTADFIKEVNIIHHFCHPLMAPPGTKLWYELKRKGRLVSPSDEMRDRLDVITNIIPKQMTRVELIEGLADYWETANTPLIFMERAIGFVKGIKRKPNIKRPGLSSMWKMRKMLFKIFKYYCFQAAREHRKAFFKILRFTARHANYLIPRVIFLYTGFIMDYKRSLYDSKIAREQAEWERTHPEGLKTDTRSIPISQKIRENASEIFTAAYQRVRKKVSDKENLYRVVVEAMTDYSDRFGETVETFDELHRNYVNESCDRIISSHQPVHPNGSAVLPAENPAPGFTREILDALDNAIRIREND